MEAPKMRTTVELDDEYHARLLTLAAQRGEKGLSHLVNAAVGAYLGAADDYQRKRAVAKSVKGVLTADEADELRRAADTSRSSWRS